MNGLAGTRRARDVDRAGQPSRLGRDYDVVLLVQIDTHLSDRPGLTRGLSVSARRGRGGAAGTRGGTPGSSDRRERRPGAVLGRPGDDATDVRRRRAPHLEPAHDPAGPIADKVDRPGAPPTSRSRPPSPPRPQGLCLHPQVTGRPSPGWREHAGRASISAPRNRFASPRSGRWSSRRSPAPEAPARARSDRPGSPTGALPEERPVIVSPPATSTSATTTRPSTTSTRRRREPAASEREHQSIVPPGQTASARLGHNGLAVHGVGVVRWRCARMVDLADHRGGTGRR